MTNPRLTRLFIFYIATLFFFAVGAVTTPQLDWYQMLVIPAWAPPPTLIAIIWCILFYLTAYSLSLFWNAGGSLHNKKFDLIVKLYLSNAGLILLWNWLFFGMHLLAAASLAALAVLISISILIVFLRKISKKSALLLTPYIAWVIFAMYLNHTLSVLNP